MCGHGFCQPVKANSGRIRRSRFSVEAPSRIQSARAMFSFTLPISGANCRQAMYIFQGRLDGDVTLSPATSGEVCWPHNGYQGGVCHSRQ